MISYNDVFGMFCDFEELLHIERIVKTQRRKGGDWKTERGS